MLPGFHRPASATNDDPMPRAGWQMFGLVDLCLMRVAKVLMDVGFSFASANAVVSQHALWDRFAHDEEPTERYLLVWPPYADHILFDSQDLHYLPARLKEIEGVATLINLAEIQRHVAQALQQTTAGRT